MQNAVIRSLSDATIILNIRGYRRWLDTEDMSVRLERSTRARLGMLEAEAQRRGLAV